MMKRYSLAAILAVPLVLASAAGTPARAGGGDVAAGLIGGLAAGTIIGAAVAARATTHHRRRFMWPQHPIAIGRAESRYGMATEVSGLILRSKSASRHALDRRCWSAEAEVS